MVEVLSGDNWSYKTCRRLSLCVNVQVRVYDPSSAARRPVMSLSYGECPMTTVCCQPNVPQYVPPDVCSLAHLILSNCIFQT